MADTEFNSAYFFENETYLQLSEEEYNPRKKSICKEFDRFLTANMKELEFKKIGHSAFQYTFENKKAKKIKVLHQKDGVFVIAMHRTKPDIEIDQAVVEKEKGDSFVNLMDRIMDALEVVECQMFGMETKTELNKTSLEPLETNEINTKDEATESGDVSVGDTDDEEEEVVDDEDDDDDDDEEEEYDPGKTTSSSKKSKKSTPKRRSSRLRKNKKRKLVVIADEGSSDEDKEWEEEEEMEQGQETLKIASKRDKGKTRRKKRKIEKTPQKEDRMEMRKRNREITTCWIKGDYVKAVHLAEDYEMEKAEINELIEYLYTNGL